MIQILSDKADTKVYLVEHNKLKCMRIIKQIFKSSIHFKELSREVFLMKDLNYPAIPQIYDLEEDVSSLYMIEEYIEGESLKSLCQKRVLKESEILMYTIQLCDIIIYLHSKEKAILYLDLKPENIIVSGSCIYLVDFGSAIYKDESGQTILFGTPGFAAPEQYGDVALPDERADIHGIGMLLYYMVSGEYPHKSKNKHIDFVGNSSKDLKRLIGACLNSNRFMRIEKVEDVKRHIEKIQIKKKKEKSFQKSIIAIAGSQTRIGTTHLACLLCVYLKQYSKTVLYLEHNTTGFLREYISNSGMEFMSKITYVNGFHAGVTEKEQSIFAISEDEQTKFHFIVKDFGVLKEDNLHEFLSIDHKILVMGGKEWEIKAAKDAAILCADSHIHIVLNFLDTKRFKKISGDLLKKRCHRMPYEPCIDRIMKKSNVFLFLDELYKAIETENDIV